MTSKELKIKGINQVSAKNQAWLNKKRLEARKIAKHLGFVTSDMLHVGPEPTHPNAWGAIFATEEWEPLGYTKTRRKAGHSRVIRQWRYKGQ